MSVEDYLVYVQQGFFRADLFFASDQNQLGNGQEGSVSVTSLKHQRRLFLYDYLCSTIRTSSQQPFEVRCRPAKLYCENLIIYEAKPDAGPYSWNDLLLTQISAGNIELEDALTCYWDKSYFSRFHNGYGRLRTKDILEIAGLRIDPAQLMHYE